MDGGLGERIKAENVQLSPALRRLRALRDEVGEQAAKASDTVTDRGFDIAAQETAYYRAMNKWMVMT